MATTCEVVQYVAERLSCAGRIRYRKMFGEYMVYVNEKPLVLVCDNTAYVKILPCLEGLMAGAERGFPYDGAKEHYVFDFEDRELAERVLSELDKDTRAPKAHKRKQAGVERG